MYFMFKLVYNLKTNKISFEKFLVLFIISTFAFLGLITDILGFFSRLFGLSSGADLAIYVSILLLFFFQFKLYLATEQNRKKLSELVRNYAINEGISKYKDFESKRK